MTRPTEYLLIILVLGMLALSAFNTCNQVTDREHTDGEFERLDSLHKVHVARTDSIVTAVTVYSAAIDSIRTHRTVTIPKKYAPKKAAVINLPDDSLQNEFRAVFGQPSH